MSYCLSCHETIPGAYPELAIHIMADKKHPRWQRKWAAGYLLKVKSLDRKVTLQSRPGRIPLTEEQKELKKSLVRPVSGEMRTVTAWCPRGKHEHVTQVEIEYLESKDAARTAAGKLIKYCGKCR